MNMNEYCEAADLTSHNNDEARWRAGRRNESPVPD